MNADGADNHPMLSWGNTDFTVFFEAEPVEEENLSLPLKVRFEEPYPDEPYEMADLLMLDTDFAGSKKLKTLFETLNIYGAQFVPVEITTNKKKTLSGHYAIHFWNRLPALDKNNYEGEEPNMFGNILDLQRFSLDLELLEKLPLEKRLVFLLAENKTLKLVHQSIVEAIQKENLTGMCFWKVCDWDDNAMFR
jgi:hypothetical protein